LRVAQSAGSQPTRISLVVGLSHGVDEAESYEVVYKEGESQDLNKQFNQAVGTHSFPVCSVSDTT